LVEALRRRFARAGSKRLEIQGILLATGVVGFIASFVMLRLGLEQMWLRYPLAALAGWLVFLGLVRLWAEAERKRFASEEEIDALATIAGNGKMTSTEPGHLRRDGESWHWLDWFNPFDLIEGGEGCLVGLLVFVVIVALGGVILSIISVIGGAELLLAEVVLDAVLVTALYRRLQHLEARCWLESAMRQTVKPVLVTIIFLAAAGLLFQVLAPDAHSIRGVWRDLRPAPVQH
jgi:hypothetical protein